MDNYDYYEVQEDNYWCDKLYHDVEFDRKIVLADNGDINAAYSVFKSYINKEYIKQDLNKAYRYLKKSAEGGHKEAQFFAGMFHLLGYFHTGKNYDEAFKWIFKSANNNNKMGMYILYKFYANGIGTPINIEESEKWKILYQDYIPADYKHFKNVTYSVYKRIMETDSEKWFRYNQNLFS